MIKRSNQPACLPSLSQWEIGQKGRQTSCPIPDKYPSKNRGRGLRIFMSVLAVIIDKIAGGGARLEVRSQIFEE